MFVGSRDWARAHGVSVAGYSLLTLVVASVAAMSWQGLTGFAEMFLHLHGPSRYMVPISLDGAAMACAFLALRAITSGDSAAGPRLMVWAFIAASATFNVLHAERAYHDAAAAFFFGLMSVAAVLLFDIVLRSIRRAALRRIGAIEAPLPRYRSLRWLVAPGETLRAWRLSIREGLTRPEDALAIVRGRPTLMARFGDAVDRAHDAVLSTDHIAPIAAVTAGPDAAELADMRKADAIRAALSVTDGDVPAALDWLRERGVTVDRSYAYDVQSGRSGRKRRASRDAAESHNTEDSATEAA